MNDDIFSVDSELEKQTKFQEEEYERKDAIIELLAKNAIESNVAFKAMYDSAEELEKQLVFVSVKQ